MLDIYLYIYTLSIQFTNTIQIYLDSYIYTFIHLFSTWEVIYFYIYTFIHLCIYTFIHLYMYTFMLLYIYTFIHVYLYAFIHLYIYTFIHIHVYTFIHLCINTSIHLFSTWEVCRVCYKACWQLPRSTIPTRLISDMLFRVSSPSVDTFGLMSEKYTYFCLEILV